MLNIPLPFPWRVYRLGMLLLVAAAGQLAAQEPAFDLRQHYAKSSHRVPMRDGVRLFTIVYAPRDTSREYPILLLRTPYSVAPYGPDEYPAVLGPSAEFDRDGYIFVFQDVRGKFRSEGEFRVMRPLAAVDPGSGGVDESTDTYDTIEWLLKNLRHHNGRVGMWGISYPGWQTVMGMIGAHPALVAASPQASPADMFIGDDFHHNGAFRLMYAFSWLSRNARRRGGPTEEREAPFDYGTPWGYRFFMDVGTAGAIDSLFFQGRVPAWNEFMEHPNYDAYWQNQNVLNHLRGIRPAVLNVAGWFDAEDFYGPISIYHTMERENPGNRSTLVVGPWLHGGWRSTPGDHLGCIGFGSKTSEYFQREVQFPFFSYYLKDRAGWDSPEAVVFETGTNVWRRYDRWPPANVVPVKLYLRSNGALTFGDGKLSWEPPAAEDAGYDEYVSDPEHPVPFSAEVRTTQGHLWMIEDQRFASTRPDVLVYQTDPLSEEMTIAGPILANLYVSTTGTDADWVAKLIDLYPGDAPRSEFCDVPLGDFQMLLAGEILRGRFRNSFTDPEPMVPGQVTEIRIDLRDRYHTFRRGHRVMVQVQSSWFPVYDRNPHTFVDIYRARPSDFRKATQRVYRSARYPSHIVLNVLR